MPVYFADFRTQPATLADEAADSQGARSPSPRQELELTAVRRVGREADHLSATPCGSFIVSERSGPVGLHREKMMPSLEPDRPRPRTDPFFRGAPATFAPSRQRRTVTLPCPCGHLDSFAPRYSEEAVAVSRVAVEVAVRGAVGGGAFDLGRPRPFAARRARAAASYWQLSTRP